MAGFSQFYVIGGQGGFGGADGVNPIEMLVLVGEGNRQWLEAHYVDTSITPIGQLRSIVPEGPDHQDALLDACIAFCPRYFQQCPSLEAVASALGNQERLDLDARQEDIPAAWATLREEARPFFASMHIWQADLRLLHG